MLSDPVLQDDDNDGLSNAEEDLLNSNPANSDSDGDGITNTDEWYQTGTDAKNPDSDGDGSLDGAEISAGTDPNNATTYPGDGDVNQDGQVNAGDLVLVMQIATGQRIPTAAQQTHADMNTDGVVDVRDVLKLQRRILELSLLERFNTLPGSQQMLALFERSFDIDLIRTAHAAVANGKLFYVHTDHLGTPQALTNEAGSVVWSASYDPFGAATVAPSSTVEMNVRLPGQYFDAETGLHYNYFRTYDPGTGRYLESDPIGLEGGLNSYSYVLNNPLKYFDLLGLKGGWTCNCGTKKLLGYADPGLNTLKICKVECHCKCVNDETKWKQFSGNAISDNIDPSSPDRSRICFRQTPQYNARKGETEMFFPNFTVTPDSSYLYPYLTEQLDQFVGEICAAMNVRNNIVFISAVILLLSSGCTFSRPDIGFLCPEGKELTSKVEEKRIIEHRCIIQKDGGIWVEQGPYMMIQDGSLAVSGYSSDGDAHGKWTTYFPNGNKSSEGWYSHGEKTGVWKYWDADGNLIKEPKY